MKKPIVNKRTIYAIKNRLRRKSPKPVISSKSDDGKRPHSYTQES